MGRCIHPGLDAGEDLPLLEGIEEFIAVIGTVTEYPEHRVLLAAVLRDLVEQGDEHPVVLDRFVGDLQAEDLVGLDVDHGMQLDPAAPNSPLLAQPFAPVGNFDPGAIGGDDDIPSEELGCYGEREIQTLDPAEEGGIVGCRETGEEGRELPDKPLHLTIGHLQEDMNASHPGNERFGILKGTAALAGIHPGKQFVPLLEELKREVEFSAPHQAFIIYTPVASVRIRVSPAFFLWHGRSAGAPVIFTFVVG